MFVSRKKLALGALVIGFWGACEYRKHMDQKEFIERLTYLSEANSKLSGVKIRQRAPFGFFWYVQWLLPYHQSLEIPQTDGSVKHVGLGKTGKRFYSMCESGFVNHALAKYDLLNGLDMCFPIEAWTTYKKKYGHYPTNVDVNKLNAFTITEEDYNNLTPDEAKDHPLYKVQCGSFYWDPLDGTPRFASCRSAVMDAIEASETWIEDNVKN